MLGTLCNAMQCAISLIISNIAKTDSKRYVIDENDYTDDESDEKSMKTMKIDEVWRVLVLPEMMMMKGFGFENREGK